MGGERASGEGGFKYEFIPQKLSLFPPRKLPRWDGDANDCLCVRVCAKRPPGRLAFRFRILGVRRDWRVSARAIADAHLVVALTDVCLDVQALPGRKLP
jgi:hypothetical protein